MDLPTSSSNQPSSYNFSDEENHSSDRWNLKDRWVFFCSQSISICFLINFSSIWNCRMFRSKLIGNRWLCKLSLPNSTSSIKFRINRCNQQQQKPIEHLYRITPAHSVKMKFKPSCYALGFKFQTNPPAPQSGLFDYFPRGAGNSNHFNTSCAGVMLIII